jgi:hypothetical protein
MANNRGMETNWQCVESVICKKNNVAYIFNVGEYKSLPPPTPHSSVYNGSKNITVFLSFNVSFIS